MYEDTSSSAASQRKKETKSETSLKTLKRSVFVARVPKNQHFKNRIHCADDGQTPASTNIGCSHVFRPAENQSVRARAIHPNKSKQNLFEREANMTSEENFRGLNIDEDVLRLISGEGSIGDGDKDNYSKLVSKIDSKYQAKYDFDNLSSESSVHDIEVDSTKTASEIDFIKQIQNNFEKWANINTNINSESTDGNESLYETNYEEVRESTQYDADSTEYAEFDDNMLCNEINCNIPYESEQDFESVINAPLSYDIETDIDPNENLMTTDMEEISSMMTEMVINASDESDDGNEEEINKKCCEKFSDLNQTWYLRVKNLMMKPFIRKVEEPKSMLKKLPKTCLKCQLNTRTGRLFSSNLKAWIFVLALFGVVLSSLFIFCYRNDYFYVKTLTGVYLQLIKPKPKTFLEGICNLFGIF